jgi:hypothetical protein
MVWNDCGVHALEDRPGSICEYERTLHIQDFMKRRTVVNDANIVGVVGLVYRALIEVEAISTGERTSYDETMTSNAVSLRLGS